MTSVYKDEIALHQASLQKMNKKYTAFGIVRFLMILIAAFSIYQLIKVEQPYYWIAVTIAMAIFFVIIRWHNQLAEKINFKETLVEINKAEVAFLEEGKNSFDGGSDMQPRNHNYSFDLDLFGDNSIFQHLNRTATYIGKQKLANLLLEKSSDDTIIKNQEAVKELSSKFKFRQNLNASTILLNDKQNLYSDLIRWSKEKGVISKRLRIMSFLLPVVFLIVASVALVTMDNAFTTLAIVFFMLNLSVLYSRYKTIISDVLKADKIHETILHYSKVLSLIENTSFTSDRLLALQEKLKTPINASDEIKNLSSLFGSLISVQNAMASVIMNGTILYHIHAYHALLKWKNEYGENIEKWLEVLGTFEALSSLANFSYNNPEFCFPKLNKEYKISFTNLGHPLINANKRICNSVSFNENAFIILTGSNMAGKSTFLRSLGVNMVLAAAGAPVCAKQANFHPLNIYVSMRLSDSLSDDESYFFAEVKRLQHIMKAVSKERSFVLLDEILRGTNSDDKRNGTIEVIKKLIVYQSIGAIATHDLEICNTTNEFPQYLVNKCFEVETINNELSFDYKLRDGICKNKSATFLMRKMEVI